jgi:hypothetical protein
MGQDVLHHYVSVEQGVSRQKSYDVVVVFGSPTDVLVEMVSVL